MWTLPQPTPTLRFAKSRMRGVGPGADHRRRAGRRCGSRRGRCRRPSRWARWRRRATRRCASRSPLEPSTRRSPCSWRRSSPCSRRGSCRRSTGWRRAGGCGSWPRRSWPRCGPCRCRRSGRPGSRGTRRSASRCRRCRCRRRRGRSGRGSGRRCGPGRWAGSATRTRRPARVHSSGRVLVAGWTRSPTATTFSAVAVGLPAAGRAPIRLPKKVLPGSPSAAPPMPTKPPPFWM